MTIRDLIKVLDKKECRPGFFLMREGVEFKNITINFDTVEDITLDCELTPYLDYEVINIFPNCTYDLWIHAKEV